MKIGTISRTAKFAFANAILAAFLVSSGVTFAGANNPGAVSPHQSGFSIQPSPPVLGGGGNNILATNIEWANVSTDWATGTNWVGGTAPADSTTINVASFGVQAGSPVNPVLGAARSVAGVSFLSGAFSYTISGSTLTIGSSGISNSATNTETFSNTVRPSINQTWTAASGATTILNGITDINGTTAANRFLTVAGAGATTFNGVVQNSFAGSTGHLTVTSTGTVTLANTNTYNGGTVVSGSGGTLLATKDGALGTGNVSLTASGVTLTLQSGATNNYIADTASLSIVTGSTMNLNFTGTPDTVSLLFENGVMKLAGLYGSAASGAPNVLPEFTGLGEIFVAIPERSTWSMLVMGAALLVGVQRWRRRRTS